MSCFKYLDWPEGSEACFGTYYLFSVKWFRGLGKVSPWFPRGFLEISSWFCSTWPKLKTRRIEPTSPGRAAVAWSSPSKQSPDSGSSYLLSTREQKFWLTFGLAARAHGSNLSETGLARSPEAPYGMRLEYLQASTCWFSPARQGFLPFCGRERESSASGSSCLSVVQPWQR